MLCVYRFTEEKRCSLSNLIHLDV